MLGDARSTPQPPFDTAHTVIFNEQLFNREGFTDLGACFRRSVDQQLVEHCPTRAVRHGTVLRSRRTGNREWAEVERVGVDGRTSRGVETLEQSPPSQGGNGARMDQVRGDRIARECRAIDHEHAIPFAREQHRCW
jgi:hypothetical protein